MGSGVKLLSEILNVMECASWSDAGVERPEGEGSTDLPGPNSCEYRCPRIPLSSIDAGQSAMSLNSLASFATSASAKKTNHDFLGG